MKLLFWRHNKAIDQRAILIADDFYSQIQPELAKSFLESGESKKKKFKKVKKKKAASLESHQVENALSLVISRFTEFRQEFRVGVYGKARLHMKFMSRLVELGYEDDTAKKINEIVMLETP